MSCRQCMTSSWSGCAKDCHVGHARTCSADAAMGMLFWWQPHWHDHLSLRGVGQLEQLSGGQCEPWLTRSPMLSHVPGLYICLYVAQQCRQSQLIFGLGFYSLKQYGQILALPIRYLSLLVLCLWRFRVKWYTGYTGLRYPGLKRLLSTTSSMFPRIRYTPKGQSTGYDYPLNYGNLQCKDRRFAEVVCCSMHYDDLWCTPVSNSASLFPVRTGLHHFTMLFSMRPLH